MDIYILRHGLAGNSDDPAWAGRDQERPLTEEGQRKTRKVAEALGRQELSLDLILSSPYIRARQTAEITAGVLRLERKLRFSEHLEPCGNHKKLIAELGKVPKGRTVLLVGHEPHLSQLISLLICGDPEGAGITLKKGGLCKMQVEGTIKAQRCASLEWLLPPSLLKGL